MRALFIHPSFPGPFGTQIHGLESDPQTRIYFMAEHFDDAGPLPAPTRHIRRLPLASPGYLESRDQAERELVATFRRGTHTAGALVRLKKEGFQPDVVCTSASSGCGLYISDIFPEARRVVHADWFHSLSALQRLPTSKNEESWRVRNLWRYGVLTDAHCAFTSTEWQKVQFPQCIAQNMLVLPQGVDTEWFAPSAPVPLGLLLPELENAQELLTVSSQSFAPEVGLPQQVEKLAQVLAARPYCHALVLDTRRDDVVPLSPEQLATLFAPVLADPLLAPRLHLPGLLPLTDYRRLLRASSLHVYLTTPCALSPELVEAMSCGCLVLASDTEPVREVIRHGDNGFLCSHRLEEYGLTEGAVHLLGRLQAGDASIETVRQAARATVLDRFNRARLSEAHRRLLFAG